MTTAASLEPAANGNAPMVSAASAIAAASGPSDRPRDRALQLGPRLGRGGAVGLGRLDLPLEREVLGETVGAIGQMGLQLDAQGGLQLAIDIVGELIQELATATVTMFRMHVISLLGRSP